MGNQDRGQPRLGADLPVLGQTGAQGRGLSSRCRASGLESKDLEVGHEGSSGESRVSFDGDDGSGS